MLVRLVVATALAALLSLPAAADDWKAARLRGGVLQQIDGQWVELKLGGIVPDDRTIRTLADGHVDFERDLETIGLGPNTQISIVDRGGEKYTVVRQTFGSVEIEAEVRNVQHFEVDTPFLAAVVKGTHFIVESSEIGATVTVTRGTVAVEALETHQTTSVTVSQTASLETGGDLLVSGATPLPPVLAADGTPMNTSASGARAGAGGNTGSDSPGAPSQGNGASLSLGKSGATPAPAGNAPAGSGRVAVAANSEDASTGASSEMLTVDIPMGLDLPELKAPTPDNWKPTQLGLVVGGIGLLAGVVIGGLALLFRRIFG